MGDIDAGPSGGSGGKDFRDGVGSNGRITQVKVRSGQYIDSIQLKIHNGIFEEQRDPIGGSGGTDQPPLNLDPDEYIISLSGTSGTNVDSLAIHTNKGKVLQCGGGGGEPFGYPQFNGHEICGFFGRAGSLIDAIGVVYRTRA